MDNPSRNAGQEEENYSHLTRIRHRAAKKKATWPKPGQLVGEVIGTLERRWERGDESDDPRTVKECENNN